MIVGFIPSPLNAETKVIFHFKNQQGEDVNISKAELLLAVWGGFDRIDLKAKGNKLVLNLDKAWFEKNWPTSFADINKSELVVFLGLQAEGYASKVSASFHYVDESTNNSINPGETKRPIVISFPSGEKMEVKKGEATDLNIIFRKPVDRFIKVVDENGNPISGIKISSSIFGSRLNRCERMMEAIRLGEAQSDKDGMIKVADGDFKHSLSFNTEEYDLIHPQVFHDASIELDTYLTDKVTVFKMHRFLLKTIKVRFLKEGKPASKVFLQACSALCNEGCGACCGPLITTDENGMADLKDFRPETVSRIFVEKDQGKVIWETDPKKWLSREGTIEVNLP